MSNRKISERELEQLQGNLEYQQILFLKKLD